MLIKVKNGTYEQYEDLLLKRDQYRKEAGQILISYTKEFGDLINTVFEKKIECIRLKKTIALCQAYINRGEAVDIDAMNAQIEREMALYYAELEEMLSKTRAAKDAALLPQVTVMEVKRIYRKLAKLLHPDINPLTNSTPEAKDLWNRIVIAYHGNNLDEMKELEVLAAAVISKMGGDEIEVDIPDIEEKIARLEREINELLTTEPYTFKRILADAELICEKKETLKTELEEFEKYSQELKQTLDQMLIGAGRKVTWRMNLR